MSDAPDLDYERWVGRERTQDDVLSLSAARALAATLDRDPDALAAGDPLPAGWHWIFFPPLARRSDLGPDGIEARGSFLPPIPLPRRMWAGGRLRFPGTLRLGEAVRRTSTIEAVRSKQGRSGPLAFVTVRHRVANADGVAVDEEQDLVYRAEARDRQAGPEAGRGAAARGADATATAATAPGTSGADAAEALGGAPEWSEPLGTDEVMLFRFSALTFNGHRIHYDHPYATGVEGYPGLVVHGPLLALLLLDAAVRRHGGVRGTFTYRAVAPVFCGEPLLIQGRGASLAVVHPERGVAMRAEVGDLPRG